VALNLGLLAMERHVAPLRLGAAGLARPARGWSWSRVLWFFAAGAVLGGGAARLAAFPAVPLGSGLGAAVAIYGYTLYFAYTTPALSPDAGRLAASESTP
jgi:hypothetical protein